MEPSPSLFDRVLEGLREAIARFLLVWLVLASLLALRWTAWLPGVVDPFAASQPALSALIAVTMFAIGSLLPREEVAQVFRRWPAVLGGTAVQYTSMPLLAYFAGRGLGLEGPLLTGVIMAGCVPGAMASNVLTLVARGNVSYSVSITTSSTLLSPIMVPLGLKLTLGQWRPLPAGEISFTLLWSVVAPVIAGYALSRRSRRWEAIARRTGSIVANLTILWIIAVVVAVNRDRLVWVDPIVLVALAILNFGGYAAGGLGAWLMRLPKGMGRALALEVGMQNAGLGTMLILTAFPDEPEAAIPTALYTFGCMFTGTLLAQYWAYRSRAEESALKAQVREKA